MEEALGTLGRGLGTLGRGIGNTASRVAVFVLGAVVGLGIPALWIWIGSQFQGGTAPSWSALVIVHVGMIGTLMLVAGFFSFFVARSKEKARERTDWMRGMREERKADSIADVHPLELIIFLAVFIDIIAMVVWFFFFADPGTPIGQG